VKGEWFFEERNGNCRLMASLAEMLSETGFLRRAVAPVAEWIAQAFWNFGHGAARKKREHFDAADHFKGSASFLTRKHVGT